MIFRTRIGSFLIHRLHSTDAVHNSSQAPKNQYAAWVTPTGSTILSKMTTVMSIDEGYWKYVDSDQWTGRPLLNSALPSSKGYSPR